MPELEAWHSSLFGLESEFRRRFLKYDDTDMIPRASRNLSEALPGYLDLNAMYPARKDAVERVEQCNQLG